jgi:methanogenic corrinoid protein MtbC1
MNPVVEAGDLIETKRNDLVRHSMDRIYNLVSNLQVKYESVLYEKWLQDSHQHLSFLAEALKSGSPRLFENYVAWCKILFANTGNSEMLLLELRGIQETLQEQLPVELRFAVKDIIDSAITYFPEMPEKQTSFIDRNNPLADLARQYLDALLNAQRNAAFQLIVNSVKSGLEIKNLYINVFQNVQREIGRLWQTNTISVAQEHFCSAATQSIMVQLYPQIIKARKRGPQIVMACVSGELHEIGARMVADFFEMEGWDVYYVGANTPAQGIIDVLVKLRSQILAVSATLIPHVSKVRELITLVRSTPQVRNIKIIVGGYPFNIEPELWRNVRADTFALDAQEAAKAVRNLGNISYA